MRLDKQTENSVKLIWIEKRGDDAFGVSCTEYGEYLGAESSTAATALAGMHAVVNHADDGACFQWIDFTTTEGADAF